MKTLINKNTLATPANLVTLGRIIMLVILALTLPVNILWVRVACFLMIPVIFYMDSLDGYLARKLKCASKLGGVLDVAGDRIVENVLWLLLAYLRVIPVWIPILVLVRGFITDGVRSVALAQGYSTFAMMKSNIEWWLVASPLSRSADAVLKALLLTVRVGIWSVSLDHIGGLMLFFKILLSLTICQCLVRGVYTVKACLKTL